MRSSNGQPHRHHAGLQPNLQLGPHTDGRHVHRLEWNTQGLYHFPKRPTHNRLTYHPKQFTALEILVKEMRRAVPVAGDNPKVDTCFPGVEDPLGRKACSHPLGTARSSSWWRIREHGPGETV